MKRGMTLSEAKGIMKFWKENHYEGRTKTRQVVEAEEFLCSKDIQAERKLHKVSIYATHQKATSAARVVSSQKDTKTDWKLFNLNTNKNEKKKNTNHSHGTCVCGHVNTISPADIMQPIAHDKIKLIADYIRPRYQISEQELLTKTRKTEVVEARQIIMYFCCLLDIASLKVIGKILGGFDHATVIHARNTIRDLSDVDKSFKNQILEYEEELHNLITIGNYHFNNFSL